MSSITLYMALARDLAAASLLDLRRSATLMLLLGVVAGAGAAVR